jgi:hypothetical protein
MTFGQPMKGRPPKKTQKYPQQPVEPQPSSSGIAQPKKPANVQQKAGVKQQQKPADKPKLQKQKSNEKLNEPPKAAKQEKPKQAATEEPDDGAPKQAKKKDGYTGGKARLNKERHKNQFKQRGADRKMQKTNPF